MKIKLSQASIAHFSEKAHIKTDAPLEIEFESAYNLKNAVVSFKNGKLTAQKKYQRVITVPPELVFAGELGVVVELFDGATVIKKWQVFPLKIVEHETDFTLYDWCIDVEKDLAELKKRTEIIL